ncbi:hypothetical protein WFJ45_22935, partial [Salmonella enterica subsp. enterica serovar Minnesota]|uniref:hypothetical protein n=1 Tax=Salmonella enterica TaxID=28901 RepID=UPI003D2E27D3
MGSPNGEPAHQGVCGSPRNRRPLGTNLALAGGLNLRGQEKIAPTHHRGRRTVQHNADVPEMAGSTVAARRHSAG